MSNIDKINVFWYYNQAHALSKENDIATLQFLMKGESMSDGSNIVYVFNPGDSGIFAEIYFPKKAVHQGAIFTGLQNGFQVDVVRKFLSDNVVNLLEELKDYPQLLDPRQYDDAGAEKKVVGVAEANQRVQMYASPFKGWSEYQVDGVFYDEKENKVYEEATQTIRLMFRFESKFLEEAREKQCQDVLHSIISWAIQKQGLFNDENLWDKFWQEKFFAERISQSTEKKKFVEDFFSLIVKEVCKWVDDCALFVFGYLIKKFAENVLAEKLFEKVIWTVSFFNMTVNVTERVEKSTT